ncbi:MAG: hypothetical protein GX128_08460 [Bacteroidales bacterium]|jgi:hypothetical protein|nr:hypothetical protein [Bacteroidales bacterium]
MAKILSTEIVSLVHHVKLNESGWWEKSIQNIIISTFGINENAPQSEQGILNNLKLELNTNFDITRISKQLETLKSQKTIIPISNDLYVLSEESYTEFKASFLAQKEIEFEAEKRFNELCLKICPNIISKNLWNELNDYLLIPLIREIGAKTYELISGENAISIDQYGQFNSFLLRYNKDDKMKIQALLLNYFDFKNDFIKKFILHQLNAYFFIEATNLNQKTIDEVYTLSKSQTNLKVFIDTNFLLTLLDLHDNPSNEAAFSLLELLDEIQNRVKVKFYVLPVTVLEFQNLIGKFKDYLIKLKPSMNQAIAAENTDEFSGIIKKYFQKCYEKNTMLNLDDYFDPYLDNFTVNIRKRGLEVQQDNMDKYSTDQRVVDDLLEQVDYRFERNEKAGKYQGLSKEEKELRRQNIYDKFNHDCQMWHYVKDKRPTYIDSTKDIVNWILTLDFSFLEYDKYKQLKNSISKISICLHPNEFISMLQFWVPRTEKFENAILGNFRLPFLFKEVDSESEKISIEILRAISQYEDSDKFSSELVAEILTNKALRQKIKPNNSVEENAKLIKEDLFKKYEVAKKQLNEEKEIKNNLTEELNIVKSEIGNLTKKIDELQEKTNRKIEKELEFNRNSRIQELEAKKSNLSTKIEQIKIRLADYEDQVRKAEIEFNRESRTFVSIIKSTFYGEQKVKSELKEKIHRKYYDEGKYLKLKDELSELNKEYNKLVIPSSEDKIIIYCENQNAKYFNSLKFQNTHFIPEVDSNGVFIKVLANPTHFGLRDRDFLTDLEIERIKKEHKNYFILQYYCFENYLYHPDNINELGLNDFNKDWYTEELIRQKDARYDKIIMNLKNVRNGYQEFKIPDNKFREKKDEIICDYLKSNDVEIFLKSYSLKSPNFDKTIIAKFQVSIEQLTATDWFRKRIEQILTF